ncbi:TetR family transcriptional regulator [Nitriliruptoraceae bacterium ZYF776]|nr:TetR family transcriptional regulator [Profundirhabdus halotolerans]
MTAVDLETLPLRERKRLQAMRRIQTVAMELFERDGFDAVTIETIAAAAEVSPSSVYRWFGTKEHLVIWDEYDPQAIAAITRELATTPPLEAVRRVVEAVFGAAMATDDERIRRRMRLAFATPAIEAASTLQAYEMANLIGQVLAAALGRDARDLEVQVTAHALAGGILGSLRAWHDSDFTLPFDQVVDASLAVLERGAPIR